MYEILYNRSVLEISGADATGFLQNLVTNNLIINDYCYTYMLNNQGRYLFDFFILKLSTEKFLIDIHSTMVEQFIKTLQLYRLRARVEFFDLSNNYCIVYSNNPLEFALVFSARDPRFNKLGMRSIIDNKDSLPLTSEAGLYINDKYRFAIVDGDSDLFYAKSIPIEYGAEELNAISYDKGCYIGQEVVSRAKYQGVIRKKIFKVESNVPLSNTVNAKGEFVNTPCEILAGSNKIGVVCSTYLTQGLALIREEEYLASAANTIIAMNNIEIKLSIPIWRKTVTTSFATTS